VGGIGRYGGPDEPAHVLRAYAVAHGDVLGVRTAGLPSGYRAVTVPRSLGTGDPTCYRHDPSMPSTCSTPAPADASGDIAFVATSAGVAPPLYYALIGLPVRLAGAATTRSPTDSLPSPGSSSPSPSPLLASAPRQRGTGDADRGAAERVVHAGCHQPELARDGAGGARLGGCGTGSTKGADRDDDDRRRVVDGGPVGTRRGVAAPGGSRHCGGLRSAGGLFSYTAVGRFHGVAVCTGCHRRSERRGVATHHPLGRHRPAPPRRCPCGARCGTRWAASGAPLANWWAPPAGSNCRSRCW
jgi:hypothetical protein